MVAFIDIVSKLSVRMTELQAASVWQEAPCVTFHTIPKGIYTLFVRVS